MRGLLLTQGLTISNMVLTNNLSTARCSTVFIIDRSIECIYFYKGKDSEEKNPGKVWSFTIPGGGGSARVGKKVYCFFGKLFFRGEAERERVN